MKTKALIKDQSRLLFNRHGVMNITLRDVAKENKKSYGNVTYHYPTKEDVIMELHQDMNAELTALQKPTSQEDLLVYFLTLPSISYAITLKYLFFSIDFIEIKRNFQKVYAEAMKAAETRKESWLQLLNKLNEQGHFKEEMSDEDLHYIMYLSGSARTAYFQMYPSDVYNEKAYCQMVNRLLKPYLSDGGMKVYDGVMATF
ncbi:TetR/AcrR family transcriptional regulator [bacterium SCSIO 12741]|nr:TetR/AcrR family transcriptional regulator [bacterium SCSIO 12741]